MCDPVSATLITGAALTAYGAHQKQAAANEAADYNTEMELENAAIADEAAVDAASRGKKEEGKLSKQIRAFKGEQRASFGASGVLVDSGSTQDVIDDTQMLGDMDAFTLKLNTAKETRGFLREAKNRRKTAEFIKKSKRDPMQAGVTSLLTSGAQSASTYYMYKGK